MISQTSLIDQTTLLLDQLDSTLGSFKEAIQQTDGLLGDLQTTLTSARDDVSAILSSNILVKLFGEDGVDAAQIADFMGSPTQLKTEELYPLNAYGSAMAPLFLNLTFWIGAFMLMVVLKQDVDSAGIKNLTLGQRYLGRFLLLAIMVTLQAVICIAGILVIGVETVSAPALFVAAVVTALAYLSIIYALSVTLQHIGKGICVILVFAQIPGGHRHLPGGDDFRLLPGGLPVSALHLRHQRHARGHLRLLWNPVPADAGDAGAVLRPVHGVGPCWCARFWPM